MKKTIMVTLVVTSTIITGISCNWFATKAENKKDFTLVGKWQVDTAHQIGNDSSRNEMAKTLALTSVVYKFGLDSTFNMLSNKDSTEEKYYLLGDTLYFKEGLQFSPYLITKNNDSLISIISKDSLVIGLKRK